MKSSSIQAMQAIKETLNTEIFQSPNLMKKIYQT